MKHLTIFSLIVFGSSYAFGQYTVAGKVVDEKYESITLTTIENTKNISIADLNKALGERGYTIANGYGKLKEKAHPNHNIHTKRCMQHVRLNL